MSDNDSSSTVAQLETISGVGDVRAGKLADAGFRSVRDLANADVDDLTGVDGFGMTRAKSVIQAASARVGVTTPGDEVESVLVMAADGFDDVTDPYGAIRVERAIDASPFAPSAVVRSEVGFLGGDSVWRRGSKAWAQARMHYAGDDLDVRTFSVDWDRPDTADAVTEALERAADITDAVVVVEDGDFVARNLEPFEQAGCEVYWHIEDDVPSQLSLADLDAGRQRGRVLVVGGDDVEDMPPEAAADLLADALDEAHIDPGVIGTNGLPGAREAVHAFVKRDDVDVSTRGFHTPWEGSDDMSVREWVDPLEVPDNKEPEMLSNGERIAITEERMLDWAHAVVAIEPDRNQEWTLAEAQANRMTTYVVREVDTTVDWVVDDEPDGDDGDEVVVEVDPDLDVQVTDDANNDDPENDAPDWVIEADDSPGTSPDPHQMPGHKGAMDTVEDRDGLDDDDGPAGAGGDGDPKDFMSGQ